MEGGSPSVREGRGGRRVAFGERGTGMEGGSPSVRGDGDGGRVAFGERGTEMEGGPPSVREGRGWREGRLR